MVNPVVIITRFPVSYFTILIFFFDGLIHFHVFSLTVLFIAEIVWLTIGMIWVCTNYSTCPAKAPKRAVLGEYRLFKVLFVFPCFGLLVTSALVSKLGSVPGLHTLCNGILRL